MFRNILAGTYLCSGRGWQEPVHWAGGTPWWGVAGGPVGG